MKLTYKVVSLLIVSTLFFSCKVYQKPNHPKNVILLISDGTGLSQISSAYFRKNGEPNYSRFDNIGLIKTSSSKQDVTDSAAGATAFASGVKTYNGAIGMNDDKIALPTIIELIQDKNIKTGLVATSSITHATPAAFYSHQPFRKMEEEIAMDLTNSDVDFFAAGGLKFFANRKDSLDLYKKLQKKGFEMFNDRLTSISSIKDKEKVGYLLAKNGMPKMQEGRANFLPHATKLAIEFLENDNGFFTMIEGSQIDWGGHGNDAEYTIEELLDFDVALGVALDFAEKDGNTLVVVVSDHETGGFTLAGKKIKKEDGTSSDDYSQLEVRFSTGGHSATLIPVFAYGPGSENFRGVYENTEIFHKIMEVTNWKSVKK